MGPPVKSAVSPPVKNFDGWYLINRASDEWWKAFFHQLLENMQRRILKSIHEERLPNTANFIELSNKGLERWIGGLWYVASLLNPFRPQ